MKFIFIGLIKLYKICLSPLLPKSCRFTPTCSTYAETAIKQHGLLSGGWLVCKRVCRCHPFAKEFVYDPVPPKKPS